MSPNILFWTGIAVATPLVLWFLLSLVIGIRYIPHSRVGIIEKLWSSHGSLVEGRIIALNGEAGYQARILRGGLHFGYPCWMFSIHKVPLVTISEGRIGYVYARDGSPLPPEQTLGRTVPCNSFQDAEDFVLKGGQRGRQRGILREGTYAINTALFIIITEQMVYTGPVTKDEAVQLRSWQAELGSVSGFSPVKVGAAGASRAISVAAGNDDTNAMENGLSACDNIGVLTVHDGPTLQPGEFIAPQAGGDEHGAGHNYFQDPEQFLTLGGRRGRQLQVLTDGTYFINRWFATVELRP